MGQEQPGAPFHTQVLRWGSKADSPVLLLDLCQAIFFFAGSSSPMFLLPEVSWVLREQVLDLEQLGLTPVAWQETLEQSFPGPWNPYLARV